MNILAFDTCLGACSVAVGLDAGSALEKVESINEEMATGQAERLMPMIAAAMRSASLDFAELDRIAVTTGPGTFTGTRIGVAAARALALATGAKVIGHSTLQLMAEAADHALRSGPVRQLVVAVDAHRGQVYAQAFSFVGTMPLGPPQLLNLANAADLAANGETIFVGSGAVAVVAHARSAGHTAEAALPQLQPNAAFLLLAAQRCEAQGETVRPLYLRPPDAKPQVGKALARAAT